MRMIGHFEKLLEEITANPRKRIAELPLLSTSEQEQLIVNWNHTEQPYPEDKTISQLIEEQVAKTPDNIAVVYENQQLTYRELDERANQLAHYLQAEGVGPEKLVAVCLDRSLEMMIALLGILKAGGAYVPLDAQQPQARLTAILRNSQARILLTQKRFASLLQWVKNEIPILICLDDEDAIFNNQPKQQLKITHYPYQTSYVIYTSGSTGEPKGVPNVHHGTVNTLCWLKNYSKINTDDIVLQKTPYTFDVSLLELFLPLMSGATLVMAQPEGHKDPYYLADIIIKKRISMLHFVPSMLYAFLHSLDMSFNQKIRKIKFYTAGEALSHSLVKLFFEKLPHCELHNLYGPTETSIVNTNYYVGTEEENGNCVSIGRPFWNTTIYILDRALNPVPIGVPGELHLGGVGLARGYLNRPDLTAEKFIANPFATSADVQREDTRLYKSGDLCRWLPDGNIEYISRIDYQVKIRGFRIELGEIETHLRNHPEIKEAIVLAREDEPGNKQLVVYYRVKNSTHALTANQLKEYLRTKLPDYMVPPFYMLMDVFPQTSNGKLDRKALLPPTITDQQENYIAPHIIHEQDLVEIWEEVLNKKHIGIKDNFFELGGHSLLLIQLINKITQRYPNVPLKIADIYQNPTIEEQAKILLYSLPNKATNIITPISRRGNKPALFIIHSALGMIFQYLSFSTLPDRPVFGISSPYFGTNKKFTSLTEMATYYSQHIKAIQPTGPYYIAGYSLGGYVAIEIARQLHLEKDLDSLVILIDIINPENTKLDEREEKEETLTAVETVKNNLIQLNLSTPQIQEMAQALAVAIDDANQLVNHYHPKPYPGRIALLSAEIEKPRFPEDKDLFRGWIKILPHLMVTCIQGYHLDLFNLEHAAQTVEKVQMVLESHSNEPIWHDTTLTATARNFIYAAQNNDIVALDLCIKRKVNINVKDNQGYTALHWAIIKQHLNIVLLLLEAGANIHSKNLQGQTAKMLAKAIGNKEIIELLQFDFSH